MKEWLHNSFLRMAIEIFTAVIIYLISQKIPEYQIFFLGAFVLFIVIFIAVELIIHLRKVLPVYDPGRQKGIVFFTVSCFALAGYACWDQILGPLSSPYRVDESNLALLLCGHRWVIYDPPEGDPRNNIWPSSDSIKEEIGWIKRAGFDGVITFTSAGEYSVIPEIAKQNNLMVIMGVAKARDLTEIARAVRKAQYVDAYVVGNGNLNSWYSYKDLVNTINYIRNRTGKFVSTTEIMDKYSRDHRLLEIGDWFFPDVHLSLKADNSSGLAKYNGDAVQDSQKMLEMAKQVAEIAQAVVPGKPILLNMVTYPMNGIPNASLTEQANFYTYVLQDQRSSQPEIPANVCLSFHSAFDIPWKKGSKYFYPWDPYTGLIDSNGIPRPAAKAIIDWQFIGR